MPQISAKFFVLGHLHRPAGFQKVVPMAAQSPYQCAFRLFSIVLFALGYDTAS
jgi:hypothetical protein